MDRQLVPLTLNSLKWNSHPDHPDIFDVTFNLDGKYSSRMKHKEKHNQSSYQKDNTKIKNKNKIIQSLKIKYNGRSSDINSYVKEIRYQIGRPLRNATKRVLQNDVCHNDLLESAQTSLHPNIKDTTLAERRFFKSLFEIISNIKEKHDEFSRQR